MTPPDGATLIEFDPHVIWALLCLFIALVVTLLMIASQPDNQKGGR